jgi:quercetin dioxygenase-like cupin family protein
MESPVRYVAAAAAFVVGVFIAVAQPIKAQESSKGAVPAALLKATVLDIEATEVREVPSGKASIRILGKGHEAFLGILTMAGGGKVPEHRDTSEEYIHVLKGSGTIFVDDKPYALKPGSTVFMPKEAKVRYENGPEELMAIQVFAGPESARKYDAWKPRK